MKVINFFGGPGSGKSTAAAGLFCLMKSRRQNVELVTEYAKDLVWEGSRRIRNQLLVTGEQSERLRRLDGKVDYAITDSPLLLGVVYAQRAGYCHEMDWVIFEEFKKFDNRNFVVQRTRPYNPVGREQSEVEARLLDETIRRTLARFEVPHTVINCYSDIRTEDLL